MARSFGQLLIEVRSQKRMKLREISEFTGLSISYLSDLEHERKRAPESEIVAKIEKCLGITDGSLSSQAKEERERKLHPEAKKLFLTRPELHYALLRAAEDKTEDELQTLIKEMEARKEK